MLQHNNYIQGESYVLFASAKEFSTSENFILTNWYVDIHFILIKFMEKKCIIYFPFWNSDKICIFILSRLQYFPMTNEYAVELVDPFQTKNAQNKTMCVKVTSILKLIVRRRKCIITSKQNVISKCFLPYQNHPKLWIHVQLLTPCKFYRDSIYKRPKVIVLQQFSPQNVV